MSATGITNNLVPTYHDHSHPNGCQLGADKYTSISNHSHITAELTSALPCFPVRKTSPLPRAITHALSRLFGNTYIARSPRRCFASISTARPEKRPPSQKDGLETSAASSHLGICGRPTSARCAFCFAQKQPCHPSRDKSKQYHSGQR